MAAGPGVRGRIADPGDRAGRQPVNATTPVGQGTQCVDPRAGGLSARAPTRRAVGPGGPSSQACEGPDEVGCYAWGAEVVCPKGWICKPEEGICRPDTPPECYEINECDYEGEKICMTDVKYRECQYGYDGCLIWDCGT